MVEIEKLNPPETVKPETDVLVLYVDRYNVKRWAVAGLFEGEWLAFEDPDKPLRVIGWVALPDEDSVE